MARMIGSGAQGTRRDDWGGTGMTDELFAFMLGFSGAGLMALAALWVLL